DDAPSVLDDEDGGVRVPMHGLQVAPLVRDRAPVRRGEDPAPLLAPDLFGERDERRRVVRLRTANDHVTTMPAPPRRGSPAAASEPSARRSTAETPPKNRFRSPQRTTSHESESPRSSCSGQPPSTCRREPSTWIRGASIASSTSAPCSTRLATWAIAPARR